MLAVYGKGFYLLCRFRIRVTPELRGHGWSFLPLVLYPWSSMTCSVVAEVDIGSLRLSPSILGCDSSAHCNSVGSRPSLYCLACSGLAMSVPLCALYEAFEQLLNLPGLSISLSSQGRDLIWHPWHPISLFTSLLGSLSSSLTLPTRRKQWLFPHSRHYDTDSLSPSQKQSFCQCWTWGPYLHSGEWPSQQTSAVPKAPLSQDTQMSKMLAKRSVCCISPL